MTKVCDLCLIKISLLSNEDCHCELKECEKPLDVKIYVEKDLTVITGESVKFALQRWRKRLVKELKNKCHTNGWAENNKAITLKGKHNHKIILQTLQPFFTFSLCNTYYSPPKCFLKFCNTYYIYAEILANIRHPKRKERFENKGL